MAEKIVRNQEKKDAPAAKKTTDTAKKAAEPVKKAAAEKKPAEPQKNDRKVMTPKKSGSSIGYRIGAIVLWILAIGFEILAILALTKDFTIRFTQNGDTNRLILLIGCIVLDMALAILAAQLWKKANRISPMSEKRGKFLFYLWNELGVIMACICFIPLIVLLIKNDKLDKKSKIIVTIIAIVALLITGVSSAEFHPISQEQALSAEEAFEGVNVYWTQFGHVFHINADECGHIKNRDYYVGEVQEAITSGKTRVCTYCAAHAGDEGWNTPEKILNWIEATKEAEKKDAPAPDISINGGEAAPITTGGN